MGTMQLVRPGLVAQDFGAGLGLPHGRWGLTWGLGLALTLWGHTAGATRGPELLPVPGIRLEVGPHALLPQPDPPAPMQAVDPRVLPDRGARLTLGLQLQVAVLWFSKENALRAWGLFPELGYLYQRRDLGTTALFNAGLGVGYMPSPWIYFAYVPRFVVGRGYGADDGGSASPDLYRLALGLRHGPIVGLFAGMLSIELSHQALSIGGRGQHEVMALFGIDILRVAVLGAVAAFR